MRRPGVESVSAPTDGHGGPISRRPLRVLWLIKGLGAGGAERLLCLAAEARDRERFRYEVGYLLPWKNALRGELEGNGVPVHCLEGAGEWRLGWAVRLRSLLRSAPFDVLHVHSPYVAAVARLVVRSLPRRVRPRVVSTEHVPWSGYVAATRLFNAVTFRLDDAHIAVSEGVRASIPEPLRRQVQVVMHGIVPERARRELAYRENARAEAGAGEGEILIGTVANLRAQKAYPDLLAAARRLLDAGAPVRFVAVGQGPLEAELQSLHRSLGLGDAFRFVGYRDNPARVMAGCDIFVLASLYEGLPLALMEALALGLPVVATAVPGVVEAITDGVEGILVPPGRPDLLAEALGSLVREPDRRARLAEAARARSTAFDIRQAVRQTEGLYGELASPREVRG